MKTRRRYARPGRYVYYHWSASEVCRVRFIGWCRMRMSTGGDDTNQIGVGAVTHSPSLYCKVIMHRLDHGLRRGFHRVCPYMTLYHSRQGAYQYDGEDRIVVPPLWRVKNRRRYQLVRS